VFNAKPWEPFCEEKSRREWVHAPSTYLDNPFIDQEQYKNQLKSACASDPELLRSWLLGDWTVARGAYFASCLEEARNTVTHAGALSGSSYVSVTISSV
jgi:phage terminase large subunit